MSKLSLAPTLLLAASAALTGCDNQTARIEQERARIAAQVKALPEINGNRASFHVYGSSTLVREHQTEFETNADRWAAGHNARLHETFESSNLQFQDTDLHRSYVIDTEAQD